MTEQEDVEYTPTSYRYNLVLVLLTTNSCAVFYIDSTRAVKQTVLRAPTGWFFKQHVLCLISAE